MAEPWRMGGLPVGNTTSTDDSDDYTLDAYNMLASIAIYLAIMSLVLLPLLPCWSRWCDPEVDEEAEMEQRKAEIKQDLVTKKVLCHGLSHISQSHTSNMEEGEECESTSVGSNAEEGKESESTADESSCVQSDEESTGPLHARIESNTCSDEESIGPLQSEPSNDADLRQCAICLEPFSVGDDVSWSKNMRCNHVYHQECITQWLLKHDDCPVCRSAYLYRDRADRDALAHLILGASNASNHCTCHCHEQSKKRERCKFCVVHGLVDPDGVMSSNDTEHEACRDVPECNSVEVEMGNEEHAHEHEQQHEAECRCEHCAPDLETGHIGSNSTVLVLDRPASNLTAQQQALRASWRGLASQRLPAQFSGDQY